MLSIISVPGPHILLPTWFFLFFSLSTDYCSLATDLFLSDPDDGTTEKSRGKKDISIRFSPTID